MRWPLALGVFAALIVVNLAMDAATISAVEVGISAAVALAIGGASGKPGRRADWGSQDGMR